MSCHKMAFKSPREAKQARARLSAIVGSKDSQPSRMYVCDQCGMYHWTSMQASEYRDKQEQRERYVVTMSARQQGKTAATKQAITGQDW